jgi:formamidopyrimidine-DNA glycosylase
MPELPDLLYIQKRLSAEVTGRTITHVDVRQPLVVRSLVDAAPDRTLVGRTFLSIEHHGPFLRFDLSGNMVMVTHLMLAGRLQLQKPGEKAVGHRCVSMTLDDDSRFHLCDDQVMAKLYLLNREQTRGIPRYEEQGIDILSPAFTLELFRRTAARHGRKQVRVMLTDQTILSAIGNAYADEILFDAGIHPKTFVGRLTPDELPRLHGAIIRVMNEAMRAVERAAQPIHVKVRDHVKVRNRHGEPCRRCGTTIRREGVRGYDVFFCPSCQPATRELFVDWKSLKKDGKRDDRL